MKNKDFLHYTYKITIMQNLYYIVVLFSVVPQYLCHGRRVRT